MNVDEALAHAERRRDLRVLMTATETEVVLAAEVRRLREVKRQVGQVRDAIERGIYGSAEEAADMLSRALRGAL